MCLTIPSWASIGMPAARTAAAVHGHRPRRQRGGTDGLSRWRSVQLWGGGTPLAAGIRHRSDHGDSEHDQNDYGADPDQPPSSVRSARLGNDSRRGGTLSPALLTRNVEEISIHWCTPRE